MTADVDAKPRYRVFPCPTEDCGSLIFTTAGDGDQALCAACRQSVAVAGAIEMEPEEANEWMEARP